MISSLSSGLFDRIIYFFFLWKWILCTSSNTDLSAEGATGPSQLVVQALCTVPVTSVRGPKRHHCRHNEPTFKVFTTRWRCVTSPPRHVSRSPWWYSNVAWASFMSVKESQTTWGLRETAAAQNRATTEPSSRTDRSETTDTTDPPHSLLQNMKVFVLVVQSVSSWQQRMEVKPAAAAASLWGCRAKTETPHRSSLCTESVAPPPLHHHHPSALCLSQDANLCVCLCFRTRPWAPSSPSICPGCPAAPREPSASTSTASRWHTARRRRSSTWRTATSSKFGFKAFGSVGTRRVGRSVQVTLFVKQFQTDRRFYFYTVFKMKCGHISTIQWLYCSKLVLMSLSVVFNN